MKPLGWQEEALGASNGKIEELRVRCEADMKKTRKAHAAEVGRLRSHLQEQNELG